MMERLKRRRKELGYSYQDLANLTQMSKSTLQRYETGGIKIFLSASWMCYPRLSKPHGSGSWVGMKKRKPPPLQGKATAFSD